MSHAEHVGISEGRHRRTGRSGRSECWVLLKPTICSEVRTRMRVAREEIFGPVLHLLRDSYEIVEEAVAIANDTVYDLGAHVRAKIWSWSRTPRDLLNPCGVI
ncbi:aldehyde dehydrogenase family protein [Mesorhizobium sp. CA14]|uniref:aldehyde dehydrogenase family protein n=1 Tax=Mesorhizobium sp. CA14 TaxID=2876642 RepID=UPI00398C92D6